MTPRPLTIALLILATVLLALHLLHLLDHRRMERERAENAVHWADCLNAHGPSPLPLLIP